MKPVAKYAWLLAVLLLVVVLSACGSGASHPPAPTQAPTRLPPTPTPGVAGSAASKTLSGHSDAVTSGKTLASGDQDNNVRLWSVALGIMVAR